MANVSSSNGLEKRPKLRFPGFDEPWKETALSSVLTERNEYAEKDGTYEHATLSKEGIYGKTARYDRDFLVSTENKKYKVTHLGDLCYNPANLKFGVICLNTYGDAIFSPIYVTFEIEASFDPDFIGAYLTRWDFINRALKYQQGTVYERMAVSPEDFVSIKCCFPQKAEQTRLAEFITLLDKRIAAQGKYVESLKKYKRGLFNQIFSAISKSSQCRKLRELVRVSGGKTPSMSNSLYWNGDIVWISSKDMKSSRISGSELKITNLALNEMTLYHPGTLLLVARSGILKHSLPLAILEVDATINQDIKALQVHGCNAFYLYYAILSQEDTIIRTLVKTGTTVQSLMMDSFLNIEIPTPDIDQQQRIIDKLAKLEKYVEVQEKELSLLSQMRNGLLQQLFI